MVKSEAFKRLSPSNGPRNEIDRISNLSDLIISKILSLLPTKDAVATSVLSTRWNFLWTSITNLSFHFDCECYLVSNPEMRKKLKIKWEKFADFVNMVLLLLDSPSIQNFSLRSCCSRCVDPSNLNSWISTGFKRVVHKLTLYRTWPEDYEYELPLSQIDCNVSVLELIGCGLIYFTIYEEPSLCFQILQVLHLTDITCEFARNSSVSFPNLKIMHLTRVMFVNEDFAHMLLSSSPVLDDLIIKDVIYCVPGSLIIHIPSLTRLSIKFSNFYQVNSLHINCSALQYLNLYDEFPCEYLPMEKLSCLVQANVGIFFGKYDVDVGRCNAIIKIMQSLCNVKFLSVSDGVLQAFRTESANITLSFHNLTRLEILMCDCIDLCVMNNSFLECMDNLEHLIMEGCWESRSSCSHHSWWTEPVNVPKCLLSQVITISFGYINVNCCDQLELLRYFLKNAQVLRLLTMSINHISEKEQLELVENISLIPRGSRACQVAFT